MNRMNHIALTAAAGLTFAFGTAAQAASITADEVETDVETALGLPDGSATYLDLQTSFTRNSATLTSDVTLQDYNFPDGSDSAILVDGDNPSVTTGNGEAADDKSNNGGEITVNVTGLLFNTTYQLYVNAIGRELEDTEEFGFGLTSGSLTDFVDLDDLPGSILIAQTTDTTTDSTLGNYAVAVGSVTTDGSGSFTVFLDEGIDSNTGTNEFRTQIDGLTLVNAIPEPASLALLGLASLCLLGRRRK